ncbi:MAG TPA: LpqB family beta-propeller domain-containing protein [Candidatus Saccharimonadales bacterium]|jgi:Tol biopolymer transport system component
MSRLTRKRIPILYLLVPALAMCVFGGSVFKPHAALGASGNGRIAFSGIDGQSNMQIYTVNADGSDVQQLTSDGNENITPVWSPDGTKIAYVGEDFSDQTDQIFVMNADGSDPVDITNDDSTQNAMPAWSPDGSKIAYVSSPSDYSTLSTINLMNVDGTNKTTLTDGTTEDFSPSWNPAGTKVAYICSDTQNVTQICAMDASGSNQQQVTSGTAIDYTSVAYSPSGTEFAYATYDTSNNDIVNVEQLGTMNTDGSNSHTLATADQTGVEDANWSPDGTKLIYQSWDNTEFEPRVYIITTDGSGETAISPDNQYTQGSSWQPVPTSDMDGDGITNAVEAAAPNNGDANGDGVADKFQANVTSIVDTVTGKYLSLQSNCSANAAVSAQAVPINYTDPAFSYPAGLVGFTLSCGSAGATATVTQYFYGIPTANTMVLRKYNVQNHTYVTVPGTVAAQVTIGGQAVTKVTYQITDGGPFDQDGSANGTIVDPAGLAVPSVGTPNTGIGGAFVFPRSRAAPSL